MISSCYFDESFVQDFAESFRLRKTRKFPSTNNAKCLSNVFPVAVWPEFLEAEACGAVRDELTRMNFELRSSDLYEFHQTYDLKHVSSQSHPHISQLCSEIYSPQFLKVMERVTGRRLGSHVDISGQRYQKGDFLLCHDDRLERRRIALVLYLVDKNCEMDGGRLWALRSDEEGRPVLDNSQTVTPKWNTLAFFEVTRSSYHQVEQVFSENSFRYSITCWFHDPEAPALPIPKAISNQKYFPVDISWPFRKRFLKTLVEDMSQLGVPTFRLYFHGKYLSCAQYPKREPIWMSLLQRDSFHRLVECLASCHLDCPTRPVSWLLNDSDDMFDGTHLEELHKFEYNFKERATTRIAHGFIHLTVVLRFKDTKLIRPTIRIHNRPTQFFKSTSKYSKVILITMQFLEKGLDLRSETLTK